MRTSRRLMRYWLAARIKQGGYTRDEPLIVTRGSSKRLCCRRWPRILVRFFAESPLAGLKLDVYRLTEDEALIHVKRTSKVRPPGWEHWGCALCCVRVSLLPGRWASNWLGVLCGASAIDSAYVILRLTAMDWGLRGDGQTNTSWTTRRVTC